MSKLATPMIVMDQTRIKTKINSRRSRIHLIDPLYCLSKIQPNHCGFFIETSDKTILMVVMMDPSSFIMNAIEMTCEQDLVMQPSILLSLPNDLWLIIGRYLSPKDWHSLMQLGDRHLSRQLKTLKLDIRLEGYALSDMRMMSAFHDAQSWRANHLPMQLYMMKHIKRLHIGANDRGWNYEQLHCIPVQCRKLQTLIVKSCPIVMPESWFGALPPSLTELNVCQRRMPDQLPTVWPPNLVSLKMNVFSLFALPVLPKKLRRLRLKCVLTCPFVYKNLKTCYDDVNICSAIDLDVSHLSDHHAPIHRPILTLGCGESQRLIE